MNTKLVAIIVIFALLIGGVAYLFFYHPLNQTRTSGMVGTQAIQSWTYESVAQDVGFSINRDPVDTGGKGVTGYITTINGNSIGLLDNDVYAGVQGATITAHMKAKIDWEYLGSVPTDWHQISQWWYRVYEKDKNNDWHQIVGNGIDTARKTFSPPMPNTLGNPPHLIDVGFNFPIHFMTGFTGGAIRVETYVKLADTNDEFLIQTEEAYIYKEEMHLMVTTNPDALIVIGVPASIDNGWHAREIDRTTAGPDGTAIFYLSENPGTMIYVTVSKIGYNSTTEMYQMDDHREVTIILGGEITPPDQLPKGHTVTVNMEPSGSQVVFRQNTETDIWGQKTSPSQYVYKDIQPGLYMVEVSNYEWRPGTYGELKWTPKEESVEVLNQDVEIMVTLDENTAPPNQPPTSDTPICYDTSFQAGKTYTFFFNFRDVEADAIRSIQIDWGDGPMESRYSVLNNNLNEVQHRYLRPGTFDIRVQASSVGWGGEEYEFDVAHGLTDPFKFGDWSNPLTINVIRVNAPPDVILYYPDVGNKGAPGVPYAFKADGFDPEGNEITYIFNWGDGTKSNPVKGYGAVSVEHIYVSVDTYSVSVQASDGKGTVTITQLQDKETGMIGTTFKVEKQKLPTPQLDLLMAGKGNDAKAVMRVETKVPAHMFDFYAEVTDSKGTILSREKVEKTYSGVEYVASITFVPLNLGDVTVKAQLVPTANVNGFLLSDVATKTDVCIGSGAGDKALSSPNIIAFDCVSGKPSHVTVIINTNYPKNSFDIYLSIQDTTGANIRAWSTANKVSSGTNKFIADVNYVSRQIGRVTIQAQAVAENDKTAVVTKTIECTMNGTQGPDLGGIYNSSNNTLQNPDLNGQLYNEQKNTKKVPGFEANEIIIVFVVISGIIIWKRRRR